MKSGFSWGMGGVNPGPHHVSLRTIRGYFLLITDIFSWRAVRLTFNFLYSLSENTTTLTDIYYPPIYYPPSKIVPPHLKIPGKYYPGGSIFTKSPY